MRLRLKLSLSESLNLELKKYGGVADRVVFFFDCFERRIVK